MKRSGDKRTLRLLRASQSLRFPQIIQSDARALTRGCLPVADTGSRTRTGRGSLACESLCGWTRDGLRRSGKMDGVRWERENGNYTYLAKSVRLRIVTLDARL